MLTRFFTGPWFLRFSSGFLRMFFPVLKVGDWVVVSRFEDVKEVLTRDKDFTISEINAANMHEVDLDFFLGMDASETHDREKNIMESVVRREDLAFIRKLVLLDCERLLIQIRKNTKTEIVSSLSRAVPLALIEQYFGVPVPNKQKMQEWMRKLFHHLFLNLNNDSEVANNARNAAAELKAYMLGAIHQKKKELESGPMEDTLLSRLLSLQKTNQYITDDYIRKNLCGIMIGAVDTTSKCVVLVLEELFKRPEVMAEAKTAGPEKLKNICYEALRFNPHNPIVVRYVRKELQLGRHSQYRIKANRKVAVGIFAAMHDAHEFVKPGRFDWERLNEYLHFGYGLHACFGRYINAVQIPGIVAAVLRLKNLRKASVNKGRVVYDGPFPNEFWLEFDTIV